uniref:NB-ARC domain-containing protein n=1 Tax=Streptomyces sp. bgisy034 TaxID=3413774 RepID=UPI003EBC1051
MPVEGGMVFGWLVKAFSQAGIRLVLGPPDERVLKKAIKIAIERVVGQADPEDRTALESGLKYCFSKPPRLRPDAFTPEGEWLRAAIADQIEWLKESRMTDTGRPFYEEVSLDPEWLSSQAADAIITALRQSITRTNLAALVHSVDVADLGVRLDVLMAEISRRIEPTPAAATRTLPRKKVFIGREIYFEQLMALIDADAVEAAVEIYAIDGMPGVGKSAFAAHVAHQLAHRFPDGQIVLSLHAHTPGQRPVDPVDGLASLLLTIGIAKERIPEGEEPRARLWRDRTADKRFLLLLDDASGSDQVRPLLPGMNTGGLVMITSRRRLTALETAVPITLRPMLADEAADLFVRLSHRPGLQSSDDTVREVVRLCGYLPLAIQMMAGRLEHHLTWTVANLATDLAAAKDRLAAMHAENISVTAAFDLSYQDLDDDQRRLFRRLSLHPGADIAAGAAAALDNTNLATARRRLDDLYDHHLIDEPTPGRYELHDLIRLFTGDLAEKSEPPCERQAAKLRLAEYYRVFLREYARDDTALAAERTNLLASLEWINQRWRENPEAREVAEILVESVKTLARFLGATASLEARITWGKRALSAARMLGDNTSIAQLCCSTLAWALLQRGEYEESESYALQGIDAATQCEDSGTADKWCGHAARTLSGIARDRKVASDALYWADQ